MRCSWKGREQLLGVVAKGRLCIQCSVVERETSWGFSDLQAAMQWQPLSVFRNITLTTVHFAVLFFTSDNFYILIKQWFKSEYVIS